MSPIVCIAREEWRLMARDRVARIGATIVLVLVALAALVSFEQRASTEQARQRYQAASDHAFDAAPDRHPHRMVHYGQFVFRPLPPLSFFDSGVGAFTGHMIFLEGHRQNSANFAEARQSSLLLRFGQLTPAFVLQTIAPLLIIFLAFGTVARERERGTLKLLLAQGVSGRQLLGGKVLGHAGVVAVLLAPAALALLIAVFVSNAAPAAATLTFVAYAAYLILWALLAVLVSAVMRSARDALLVLAAIWMVSVVLLPRSLPQLAAERVTAPARVETEVAIQKELKAIGDSHNPDDPYFEELKRKTLARYGVSNVDDLPVQWSGLVAQEGERLTSQLFDRYAGAAFEREREQSRFIDRFAVLSPVLALRAASMALAGTDVTAHQNFLDQAEAYRYAFVQQLTEMQIKQLPNRDDREDPRIAAANWKSIPAFAYRSPHWRDTAPQRLAVSLAILAGWLFLLGFLLLPVGRRLERAR